MVQSLTKLNVIDNSGATGAKVIRVLNKKKVGRIGSLVVVTITKNVRNSKIRKGTVHKGIIVRTKVKSKEFNQSLK
jgi:large subunit ribosomal protein L14